MNERRVFWFHVLFPFRECFIMQYRVYWGYVKYRAYVSWNYTVYSLTGHEQEVLFSGCLCFVNVPTLLTHELLFTTQYGLIYEDLENCSSKQVTKCYIILYRFNKSHQGALTWRQLKTPYLIPSLFVHEAPIPFSKLILPQVFRKFTAFYRTLKLIIIFKTDRHMALPESD
jgi:hypothetical protein